MITNTDAEISLSNKLFIISQSEFIAVQNGTHLIYQTRIVNFYMNSGKKVERKGTFYSEKSERIRKWASAAADRFIKAQSIKE